ncbi:MAG TPA: OsmC family protein [Thermodesulfobacteriota bacterium]|nr:OsmC family protein [Thermodesulfobacteriota bacterium]
MARQRTAKHIQDTVVNGVNVTRLGNTVEAIKGNAEVAKFRFRASNKWFTGAHNRTTIKDFYGACQEDASRKEAFVLDNDEPDVLLGEDKGANPVEYVLSALLGCMTTTMIYKAAANGIVLDEVDSSIEGDLDLRGMLELEDGVRNGFQDIRVRFTVKTDAQSGQLEILERLCRTSPVFDIITNPVPVSVTLESK